MLEIQTCVCVGSLPLL